MEPGLLELTKKKSLAFNCDIVKFLHSGNYRTYKMSSEKNFCFSIKQFGKIKIIRTLRKSQLHKYREKVDLVAGKGSKCLPNIIKNVKPIFKSTQKSRTRYK